MRFKKIIIVAGARPNFMKVAPFLAELRAKNHELKAKGNSLSWKFVHTGQHYDYLMSKVFFEDLKIPEPDIYLGVGSGSHAVQTAKVMMAFEQVLSKHKPDLVMVVGDVNSTLACALTAYKIGIAVAHVEAGLRSFDRSMPEEANRVVTDHLSDILFTPSKDADLNLIREGIDEKKIFFVGNIMIDTLKANLSIASSRPILNSFGLQREKDVLPYCLVTLHRPSNVDNKNIFTGIVSTLGKIAKEMAVLYLVHPRAAFQIKQFRLEKNFLQIGKLSKLSRGLYAMSPLGYLDFIKLMMHAICVLTDSGGLQEETTFLNVPCLTLRENTERPITVSEGTNKVVGVKPDAIYNAWLEVRGNNSSVSSKVKGGSKDKKTRRRIAMWDGKTAERIVKVLCRTSGYTVEDELVDKSE